MKGLNAEEISTIIYLSTFSDTAILWCITWMLITEEERYCSQWNETEPNNACQQQKKKKKNCFAKEFIGTLFKLFVSSNQNSVRCRPPFLITFDVTCYKLLFI